MTQVSSASRQPVTSRAPPNADASAPQEPDCRAGTGPIPRRSRPTPRPYNKHGLVTLKATLRALGPRVIDRRTHMGRALAAWRADLMRDLGGDVTTAQAALIDLAVRTRLLLDSIDAWLLAQPSVINVRKRTLIPVVKERAALVSQLQSLLRDLGLERRTKPVETLRDFIAARSKSG